MESTTEGLTRQFPRNITRLQDLPDSPLANHPTPWRDESGQDGHYFIYDANEKLLFHVYAWDKEQCDLLTEKLNRINRPQQNPSTIN